MITLTVNGRPHRIELEARTHLADALREHCGLTGTHLGCEQGVCGACTVLLDGRPVRACLISAQEAAGHAVTSIEGLDDDPVAAALRAAFTRHHALQCGYCTPGMIVTARDIVLRLGAVDEARLREELAGNLCRCTGYRGILRAVAEVAATRPAPPAPERREAPAMAAAAPAPDPAVAAAEPPAEQLPNRLAHREFLRLPVEAAWAVLSDPARLVACLPGATLASREGDRVSGEIAIALGPFAARFRGEGRFTTDAARHAGRLLGRGRDGASATEGELRFRLGEAPGGSMLHLEMGWRLTGPLAQFARPALLRGVVAALVARAARRIEAAAAGETRVPGAGFWARLRRWLAAALGRR